MVSEAVVVLVRGGGGGIVAVRVVVSTSVSIMDDVVVSVVGPCPGGLKQPGFTFGDGQLQLLASIDMGIGVLTGLIDTVVASFGDVIGWAVNRGSSELVTVTATRVVED